MSTRADEPDVPETYMQKNGEISEERARALTVK